MENLNAQLYQSTYYNIKIEFFSFPLPIFFKNWQIFFSSKNKEFLFLNKTILFVFASLHRAMQFTNFLFLLYIYESFPTGLGVFFEHRGQD